MLIWYGYLAHAFAKKPIVTHTLLFLHEGQPPPSPACERFVALSNRTRPKPTCTTIRNRARNVDRRTCNEEFESAIEGNRLLPDNISNVLLCRGCAKQSLQSNKTKVEYRLLRRQRCVH